MSETRNWDKDKLWEKERTSKVVKCPYYKEHSKWTIRCEGYMKRMNVQLNYERPDERKAYMDDFCYTECWRGCAVAQLASDKYE